MELTMERIETLLDKIMSLIPSGNQCLPDLFRAEMQIVATRAMPEELRELSLRTDIQELLVKTKVSDPFIGGWFFVNGVVPYEEIERIQDEVKRQDGVWKYTNAVERRHLLRKKFRELLMSLDTTDQILELFPDLYPVIPSKNKPTITDQHRQMASDIDDILAELGGTEVIRTKS